MTRDVQFMKPTQDELDALDTLDLRDDAITIGRALTASVTLNQRGEMVEALRVTVSLPR